jgi:hypothetical protein
MIKASTKTVYLSILVSNVVVLSPLLVPYDFEREIAILKDIAMSVIAVVLSTPLMMKYGQSPLNLIHLNMGSIRWHECLCHVNDCCGILNAIDDEICSKSVEFDSLEHRLHSLA